MCVIAIKKKGIKFPSEEIVKAMCENNPHGFSLVISNGSTKPWIYKTLSMDSFMKVYRRIYKLYDYRTSSMFIHTRIKTHGTEKIQNCHGWKQNGLIFAHNGILSIANRDDMTDSETYFRDIFSPVFKSCGWRAAERTIDAVIGSSKFVFMDDSGDIRHYGQYIEDDGVLYSNTSYQPRPKYAYLTPSKYGGRYGRLANGYYSKSHDSAEDWNRWTDYNDAPF